MSEVSSRKTTYEVLSLGGGVDATPVGFVYRTGLPHWVTAEAHAALLATRGCPCEVVRRTVSITTVLDPVSQHRP